MGYENADSGDLEKLQKAFGEILQKFGSVESVLEAFGLADLPLAQRYGILFGCVVFVCTVSAVLALLVLGGSFKRIKQQAETGEVTLLAAHDVRTRRSLLLEQLLEGRQRMLQHYPKPETTTGHTPLTKMLETVAPVKRVVPPQYEENYTVAYRACQDRPGGKTLPGRPEARFEAYSRAYAGCGPYTATTYRRSFARLYEATCCLNHSSDEKYSKLFEERPNDIVGRYVRLEALEVGRHAETVHKMTSGQIVGEHKSYDPEEVWSFFDEGPFAKPSDLAKSFVFQRKLNEAGFAVVDNVTDRVLGAVLLRNDNPQNLSIVLEPPFLHPTRDATQQQLESCFLLMDRLFALGYRRIEMSIDAQDMIRRKLAIRLGFTLEGILQKHMIVKEASRDSSIYGLLNSDWNRGGARGNLFTKLYGAIAAKADASNEKRESELEEQQKALLEQRASANGDKVKKN